jgi:hypothetical protein
MGFVYGVRVLECSVYISLTAVNVRTELYVLD